MEFNKGPQAYGCPACQAGNHGECQWLQQLEELNSGAHDPEEMIVFSPNGICGCAVVDEEMHFDAQKVAEMMTNLSAKSPPHIIPSVHTCWEVCFRPHLVTEGLIEAMMTRVGNAIYSDSETLRWFGDQWGDVGIGGHLDSEITFVVDADWEPGHHPMTSFSSRSGVVTAERRIVLSDFQTDCVRLAARLGYEGWSTAQVIVSANRRGTFASDTDQETPAS